VLKLTISNWARCSGSDMALNKLRVIHAQRSKNAPGGSLLRVIETSIENGHTQEAAHELEKYMLIANDLSSEHCAILQSALEDIRRANRRVLSLSNVLKAIWRLFGLVATVLKFHNKNPLNSFLIEPNPITGRVI
jgi:hypothetical protein